MNTLEKQSELTKIQTGLEAFEQKKAELQQLADSAKDVKINGIDDKAGYRSAREKRIELRNAEIAIEKEAKAMRDLVTPISRHISAKEKELLSITEFHKERLTKEEKWFQSEQERIKQEKEAAEKARVQNRIDKLSAYNAAIDYAKLSFISDEEFDKILSESKCAYDSEQARIAAEMAEHDRLKREEEERIRIERLELEKIKAEQERIRQEQEEKELSIQKEQARIAAEKKAIEDAKIGEERKKQREAEIEAAKKEAADKAIREENERKIAEENERKRQEELKPDKEKVLNYMLQLRQVPTPNVNTPEAIKAIETISEAIIKVEIRAAKIMR